MPRPTLSLTEAAIEKLKPEELIQWREKNARRIAVKRISRKRNVAIRDARSTAANHSPAR